MPEELGAIPVGCFSSAWNLESVTMPNSVDIIEGGTHTLTLRNAFVETSPSYYAIYTIRGDLLEKQLITSSFQEVQLPQSAGMYIFYIYFEGKVYQRKFIVP